MSSYDLPDRAAVARYLQRENLEHDTAFENWRAKRLAEGFHVFRVEHGDEAQTPPSELSFNTRRTPWNPQGWN